MDEEKKTVNSAMIDPNRPNQGWDTSGCPFIFFGDDTAAKYDLEKLGKFFDKFKKKK